jgi:hypothetical protein
VPRPVTFARCNISAGRRNSAPNAESGRPAGALSTRGIAREERPAPPRLPFSSHTPGRVTASPEWAADIQSLVAVVGMVVRSGMSNTALRSMPSAFGMT